MFIFDRLLVGGIRFVLDKLANVADAELNDSEKLRERLLDAQMRFELGELSQDELADIEGAVLARLRELEEERRAQSGGGGLADLSSPDTKVTGIEVSFGGDDDDDRR